MIPLTKLSKANTKKQETKAKLGNKRIQASTENNDWQWTKQNCQRKDRKFSNSLSDHNKTDRKFRDIESAEAMGLEIIQTTRLSAARTNINAGPATVDTSLKTMH